MTTNNKDLEPVFDRLVDEWHMSYEAAKDPVPLHTYLGMSWVQYRMYLTKGEISPSVRAHWLHLYRSLT